MIEHDKSRFPKDMYCIEGSTLNGLIRLAATLGCGKKMNDDERRDWSNWIVARLNSSVFGLGE